MVEGIVTAFVPFLFFRRAHDLRLWRVGLRGLWRMNKAPDFDRLLAKVDQQTQTISTLMQVKQALLDVFGLDGAARLGLHNQFGVALLDPKVNTPLGHDNAIVGYRDFDFSFAVQTTLLEGDDESALIILFHAVQAQLALHVDTCADHRM